MRIAISIAASGLHGGIVVASRSIAAHGTPPQKPDPQYRKQDHIIFAALAVPIFAVTFVIVALVVTLGQR
ncbi:MAG TPA: hypothetical protein VIN74_02345 [Candidatus Limnocylindria bacterium]